LEQSDPKCDSDDIYQEEIIDKGVITVKIGSEESISSFQKPSMEKNLAGSEVVSEKSCGKSEIMIESKKRIRINFGTSQQSFTAENSRQVQIPPKSQEKCSEKTK
jgi:hypothetical protein